MNRAFERRLQGHFYDDEKRTTKVRQRTPQTAGRRNGGDTRIGV